MPLPQIVAVSTPPSVGRHVFVSYSHRDGKLAAAFMEALHALAGNSSELCLSRERIFFDRGELLAGDAWDDRIASALQTADLLLFLVSNASLTSAFCLTRELAIAAAHGKVIVPVLLSPTSEWENRIVPGDARSRRLGDFNAVPSDLRGPQPISGGTWANRSAALAQTMTQIAARLRRDLVQAASTIAASASGLSMPTPFRSPTTGRRAVPALLPNQCNQKAPELSFESGLDKWTGHRALLVLVKGEYLDDTTGFWDRVREKNLASFCEQEHNLPLRPGRPLELPRAEDAGNDAAELLRAVRRQLSYALTGKTRAIGDGGTMAALLANFDGVQPLWGTLPRDTPEACGALLRALVAVLNDVPGDAPMNRLALAVLVEDPALFGGEGMVATFALKSDRVHVVDTARLKQLTGDDVRLWHRSNDLEAVVGMDEEKFARHLFGDATEMRHREFDHQVRPLLGLSRQEARA